MKCETENVKLPQDRETVLALSLREAATNVRRNSQASVVTIVCARMQRRWSWKLPTMPWRAHRAGNGLNGMRERLGTVGGSLTLWPNPDGGTLLRACIPLAA